MKTIVLTILTALLLAACVDSPDSPKESTAKSNLCTEDNPGCVTAWQIGQAEGTAVTELQSNYEIVDEITCGTGSYYYGGFVSECGARYGNYSAWCSVNWDFDGWGTIVITAVSCHIAY